MENAVLEELRQRTVLTLAVIGEAGPHAVSLMYAHDAFDIYWLSDPKSHHSKHLASSSSAAVTIAAQYEDFRNIRGLQMQGNGHRLTDADEESMGFELLRARFPFLKQFAVGNLARHLGAAAIYLFRPATLTLIDNSRGFGFKQTLELADRSAETMVPD
ncbi:MAG: pyridoxamine 5'-phosphate oxidase family protein [Hyphomicrobiales bacterium]|nr:pyridoxamine 5'-phosphate oxidase family protein [Hyphomicrobiales bacterium]